MLVAPGDDLGSSSDLDPGHGVIVVDGRLKAVKQGRITNDGKQIGIQPRRTAYVPRPSDLVIGYVEGMTNNIWFIDIGAPFNAILPLSLGPAKGSFGGLRSVLDVGDAILCRIQEVEENHWVQGLKPRNPEGRDRYSHHSHRQWQDMDRRGSRGHHSRQGQATRIDGGRQGL